MQRRSHELDKAVRAALRYDGIGNLSRLRDAAGLSGAQFGAMRRGHHSISPAAARRLLRVLRTWAEMCARRADRLRNALQSAGHGQDKAVQGWSGLGWARSGRATQG